MNSNFKDDSRSVSFEQSDPKAIVTSKKAFKEFVSIFGEFDDAMDSYRKKLNWRWKRSSEKEIIDNLTNETEKLFLAKMGDEIVGFATLWKSKLDDIYLIAQLAVTSKYRNKKIGRGLLQFISDNVNSDLQLAVTVTNDIGNHLYESVGFVPTSRFMRRAYKNES